MYSGILLSTSSLYQTTYPFRQNQKSDMDPPLPPGFAPFHPGFGENQYEKFHGQPHSAMNHAYQEHQMYSVHETPSQGFGFQHGQVMDSSPFYNQGFRYQYSVQQQVMAYPVTQPATQPRPQQVQVERITQEVLTVELEPPVSPLSRRRLRWTPELHERFNRAVKELGGYFKATPKGILEKMNVKGITREHLKSHLQKVRNRVHAESPAKIMGPGTQYDTNSSAPQFSEGQHGRLLGSCEALNHHNHMIGPVKDPANGPTIPLTSDYHQNLWRALTEDRAHKEMKFKDSNLN
ncbi:uncharacterized protein LOC141689169 [Apium graveolens]|uniref:uncharacterized protein LOC141689169 n=1 Tax=Apium graveolens TaxID=4045 RepID=UPI003D79C1E1